MISVFIYDENIHYQKMIYECINNHILTKKYDMEILLCTANHSEILKHIVENEVDGMYFLTLEQDNGHAVLEAAKSIRENDPRGFIVFVSDHSEFILLIFEYMLEALGYIPKAHEETLFKEIRECLDIAYSRHVLAQELYGIAYGSAFPLS